ncbi:type II toxin-antitoxin system VapC family toxin [Leucobacter insecticola]|uniref:Type II toxin-antitoxin system VapC family toxin n=1 Tax=Leucobacter insecticola TaxID=2714934 RepID=A0A6G8FK12_9MICO|nr:type II toxin-antitoxin system VapC family toxin [Leucobacter insecticola]QIM16688.1 type II toxin-antitoxin system VapC family toxin [Leucobacter insecticola]
MSYLLDTNVISELRKPERRADARVRSWASSQLPSTLFLSVITVMEVEIEISRLQSRDPFQSGHLRSWMENDLLKVFAGRILPLDLAAARRAAQLHVPDPRPERDAMIAATASTHGLTVATRNVKDFQQLSVAVINPWQSR